MICPVISEITTVNYREAVAHVLDVVKNAPDLPAGVRALFSYCRRKQPRSKLWSSLAKIDFSADAEDIAKNIRQLLRKRRITRQHTGLYFGLDGLNMPRGKGVEFGCSRKYNPLVPGIRWVYECDVYPGELPSAALSALYTSGVGLANLADYVICLGYLGLALRQTFEMTPTKELLRGAPYRSVIWGFHDGDLLILGTIHPDGFERRACHDPDPDATAQHIPRRLPGTRLGEYFLLSRSYNRDQWILALEDAGPDFPSDLHPRELVNWKNGKMTIPLRVFKDGSPVALSEELMTALVVNSATARILKQLAPGDLRYLPANICGVDRQYYVLGPTAIIPARSAGPFSIVISSSAARGRQMFWTDQMSGAIVTARMKKGMEKAGITSRRFDPLLSEDGESAAGVLTGGIMRAQIPLVRTPAALKHFPSTGGISIDLLTRCCCAIS